MAEPSNHRPPKHPRKPVPPPPAIGALEEQFVSLYLHDLDLFKAYCNTYPTEGLTLGTVKFRALQLIQSDIIRAHIAKLRAPLYTNGAYTLEQHISELEALRNLAIASNNLPAAAKMLELMGKASGHYVERSQQDINQTINQVTEIKIQFVDPPAR